MVVTAIAIVLLDVRQDTKATRHQFCQVVASSRWPRRRRRHRRGDSARNRDQLQRPADRQRDHSVQGGLGPQVD